MRSHGEGRGRRALAAVPVAGLVRQPELLPGVVVRVERREEGRVRRVDGAAAGAVDGDADQRHGAPL